MLVVRTTRAISSATVLLRTRILVAQSSNYGSAVCLENVPARLRGFCHDTYPPSADGREMFLIIYTVVHNME
jgi:hypothetical protein